MSKAAEQSSGRNHEKVRAAAAPQSPSAAKAVGENKPFIAAVNRCATQKQEQNRVFQHSVKPPSVWHT
jgi:hypothetical protein